MHNDLQDSIKARLYDMKYTPFLASYVISWIFFNAKAFLIFFSDIKVSEKIEMLAYEDLLYLYPLYVALFYTLVFPIFGAGFYYVTLQYKRLMNKIKQKIQDITPLPQEEANELLRENADLRLEHDKKIKELNLAKESFQRKEQELNTKQNDLEESLAAANKNLENANEQINTKNAALSEFQSENESTQNTIKTMENRIEELEKQLNDCRKKNNPTKSKVTTDKSGNGAHKVIKFSNLVEQQSKEDKLIKSIDNLTEDEKEILKIIYENNISFALSQNYIQSIYNSTTTNNFKTTKIRHLLDNLVKKELISLSGGYYDTTAKGREVMIKLFD